MTRPPRLYDTFLFDGELDLLEHRLRETYDLVDVFVLVEAGQTFRGAPKPLTFRAHKDRFAWASEKLRPIALHALGHAGSTPWERQTLQRNALMLGLRDAAPDDIVLILDVDEVPSRSLLEHLRSEAFDAPRRLSMTRHYEYLDFIGPRSPCCPDQASPFPFDLGHPRPANWDALEARWFEHSGVVAHYRDLTADNPAARSAYDLRRTVYGLSSFADGGRHFCAVDPAARLESKLGRVSHTELGDKRGLSAEHLRRARRYGVHHHGWWYAERPSGALAADLERLAERAPQMKRPAHLPPMVLRRMVRSWTWLRFAPWLPDGAVSTIDRHFEALLPLLALPLLGADLLRAAGAHFKWQWLRGASLAAKSHGHG